MSEFDIVELRVLLNNLIDDVKELKEEFKDFKKIDTSKNLQCANHNNKIENLEREIKEIQDSRKWLQRTIIATALSTIAALILHWLK